MRRACRVGSPATTRADRSDRFGSATGSPTTAQAVWVASGPGDTGEMVGSDSGETSELPVPGPGGPRQVTTPCLGCGDGSTPSGPRLELVADQISLDAVPTRPAELAYFRRDGELTITRGENQPTNVLNGSASVIWWNLDGTMSLRALVEALHHETGVSSDQLARDVRETVLRCVALGLLLLGQDEFTASGDRASDGSGPRSAQANGADHHR